MSDGIFCRFVADQIAIGVIRMACNYCAVCIHDGHDIALKNLNVVVGCRIANNNITVCVLCLSLLIVSIFYTIIITIFKLLEIIIYIGMLVSCRFRTGGLVAESQRKVAIGKIVGTRSCLDYFCSLNYVLIFRNGDN